MFGGYTEVAAYYVDPDPTPPNSQFIEQVPLPGDYLPEFKAADPWFRTAACQDDFVMLAEFSEQEGPKPLMTIPSQFLLDSKKGFDLNDFAVRIMSVDQQTMPGETFTLNEDSQVMASETKFGVYSFVHHFTLYDSQARGFVRPFCMAYVTPDHSKLIAFHSEMTSEFSKVSHCFKYGNLLIFVRDMTHYLSDLMYTKERFHERQKLLQRMQEAEVNDLSVHGDDLCDPCGDPQEESILSTITEQGIETAIQEVKRILDVTTVLMNDSDMEQRFRKLEEKSRSELNGLKDNELNTENFQYSCSLQSEGHWSDQDKSSFRRSGSFSELIDSWDKDQPEMYKPKVVRTNNKKRFDKSLRTLHELCRWGAKEGLNRLRSLHQYFYRDMTTLHIERSDASSMDPSPGLLTIGRNVQLNFLSGSGIVEREAISSEDFGTCSLVSSPTGHLTRRWLSDDTLASFHSAESFLSCAEEAIPSNMDSFEAAEPAFIMGNAYVEEKSSSSSGYELAVAPPGDDCSGDPCGLHPVPSSSDFTVVRPDALEFSRATPLPRVSVISAADHVTNLCSKSPGYGILNFANRYAITPHVLYSLLCGRPLVILGSNRMEADIRGLVTALWSFVPGHSSHSHSVSAWITRPLALTDLQRMRLVGMGRPDKKSCDHMLPGSIKNYVTVLNLETKTLFAPPYLGGILTEIYKKRKTFKTEQTYLSYIHSVLFDLSHKAQLYFHAFSTSEMAATNDISNLVTTPERNLYKHLSSKFCAKLRLADSDVLIVQYLVEVIQGQQMHDLHLQQHAHKDLPTPTAKLDYRKCSVFKIS